MKKSSILTHIHILALCVLMQQTYAIDEYDILKHIETENIQFIDCNFTDLMGNLREITIPAQYMQSALQDGIKFDGSSIPGCTQITQSDMTLKLDMNTFQHMCNDPAHTYARILCNMSHTIDKPFDGDPRYILQKAMHAAETLGYEFVVGPELEFFIFEKNPHNTPQTCDDKPYFDAQKNIPLKQFQTILMRSLLDQGIPIEKIHHEVAKGQYEMSFHYDNALKMADYVAVAKHIMLSLADHYGYRISFMPKPIYGQNGSALHLNFSLRDKKTKQNIFYSEASQDLLSDTAKQFIAGVLKYSAQFTVICNPSINSYKRLVRGYEAPIFRCWGKKNRSALIRIPEINPQQTMSMRGEIRSPDPLCNPYLAFACILQSGLNGLQTHELADDAIEQNLYVLSEEELAARNIKPLPTSLQEAVEMAQQGAFIADLLGEPTTKAFFKIKKQEVFEYNTAITDWELKKYM